MVNSSPDFLIIGGGIVGLTCALELARREPDAKITLLEKEARVGLHASGRNSGVLHAGFYYTADSLKARFTVEGNRELAAYCEAKGLRLNRCGKLIVARDESEWEGLDELLRRAEANGVELHDITAAEARRIEPRVKTCERALFSPNTATADPREVIESLAADARDAGIELLTETAYLGRVKKGGDLKKEGDGNRDHQTEKTDRASGAPTIRTSRGDISAGFVINAAGLYADRVAHDFGFGARYKILPFKGLYLYSNEPPFQPQDKGTQNGISPDASSGSHGSLRTCVYPVPDLKNPFLGVHFTVTADGRVKIGPTATPAFWRENYSGLSRFRLGEFCDVAATELGLLFRAGFDFRGLALAEIRKYWKPHLLAQAGELVEGIHARHYKDTPDHKAWGRPGIRAQLLDIHERRLVMDFCLEGDARSLHILNAISPAWTCSLPFARHLADEIERLAKTSA